MEVLERRHLLAVTGIDLTELAVNPDLYDSSRILVRFKPEAPELAGAAILAGTELGTAIELVPGLRSVQLAPDVSVETALAAYKTNPYVLYAEPDYRVQLEVTLNDPQFSSLWGLNNTGQTGGMFDADIDALEAWDTTTGGGTTIVAVIDTGVDYTHPDLAANIWNNPGEIAGNGQDDDGNGYVDDVHGYDFVNLDGDPMDDHSHGTHVAGTIGAVGNNGVGVAGVNWNVQIMALKFLDAFGGGFTEDAIQALNYAVAKGAKVSNNSWGGGGYSQALFDAINSARTAGHIFVAAAGNDGSNNDSFPFFPASYNLDNIIAVAATDHNDNLASFSNYGATLVDLGAPGVNIRSTTPANTYDTFSGTSMATPHVTGVVALVQELHPEWFYGQVVTQILSTVDPIPALAGTTVSGGRLNAAAAVGAPAPDTRGPRVVSASWFGAVAESIDTVRVTWSEPITASTFTPVDISGFTGPGGSIVVSSVTVVNGTNNRQFDIKFQAQTTFGSYTMTIGPNITDLANNPMNQDNDGTNGEPVEDRYTTTFSLVDVLVFTSTDVPAPILDWTYTISYLEITPAIPIADINVEVDLSHTWIGDLEIYLASPAAIFPFGPYVELFLYRGGGGDNLTDTVFDDEASTHISAGTAPFTGSFRPEGTLSDFDGLTTYGLWQLWIGDVALEDQGMLLGWKMIVTPEGSTPPPPPPDNNAPIADDDSYPTNEDQALAVAAPGVLDGDTDADGDPLTAVLAAGPSHGNLVLNANGSFTYTPAANYFGPDSFTYRASDGTAQSNLATVSLTINPVNDAPTADDDSYTTDEDQILQVAAPGVLDGDADADGDPLTAVLASGPAHGTLTLNANGSFTYTPAAGYVGPDSFTYRASDGAAQSNLATVSITVEPVNNAPVADDDSYSTNEDQALAIAAPGVLDGDTDADGDTLTAVLVSQPTHGTLSLNANGSFTYTPEANYFGTDSFTYRASDGTAQSNLATVSLTISPVNDAPTADDDSYTTDQDQTLQVSAPGVLDGDADADGNPLTAVLDSGPAHGTLTLNADGSFTYTPAAGYFGPDSFTYRASDGTAQSGLATVSITVNPVSGPTSYYLFSAAAGGTLVGSSGTPLAFTDADIVRLAVGSSGAYEFELHFDGSDVGLTTGNEDIDAFDILPNGSIVLSTVGTFSVPGPSGISIGGGGQDLLLFTPTSLGSTTAGVWHTYFDGSDVGLTTNNENVDAVSVLEDGRILVSTSGNVSVSGASGDDKDLLAFTPTVLGDTTAGTWATYFDGSDVELTSNAEDVDALFVDAAAGAPGLPALFFSTRGNFAVTGASGTNDDVFQFTPTLLGGTTTGSYAAGLTLDGSQFGLDSLDIDGIHLGLAPELAGTAVGMRAARVSVEKSGSDPGTLALLVPDAIAADMQAASRQPAAALEPAAPAIARAVPRDSLASGGSTAAAIDFRPAARKLDEVFARSADDWCADQDRLDDLAEWLTAIRRQKR